MAQPTDDSPMEIDLKQTLKAYKEDREKVLKIYYESNNLLQIIQEELKGKVEEELLKLVDMDAVEKAVSSIGMKSNGTSEEKEFDNPCIAIVGQTKAGKSCFINTLLKEIIVAQKETRCTARLTHLYYSEKNIVEHVQPDGTVTFSKDLKSSRIPPSFLGLSTTQRRDPTMTNIKIRAGIASHFLQQGVDIIDSPGLNENAALNDLSCNMVESLLPMIIYVIDGRKSLTEADIADITRIKSASPQLRILYFVTKLDMDKYTRRDHPELSPLDYAYRKLDMAYKKLQRNGFIAEDIEREKCREFHGASLWHVTDYYKDNTNEEIEFHAERFFRFQKCLLGFIKCHLEGSILEAVNKLTLFHEGVLEKIINRARVIVVDTRKKLNDIETIRNEETLLYTNAMALLNDSGRVLHSKLIEMLENKEERILQPLQSLKYEDITIPDDGIVKDIATIEKCQTAVYRSIALALDSEVRAIVEYELLSEYMRVEEGLRNDMERLQQGVVGKTSFRRMLENLLFSVYRMDSSTASRKNQTAFWSIKKCLKDIIKFFKSLFTPSTPDTGVIVNDLDWKIGQGRQIIRKMNREQFADYVCSVLVTDMEQKHTLFEEALKKEKDDIERTIEISEDMRKRLIDMAPRFAIQFMFCLDIRGRYQLCNLKVMEKIGEGAQGKVMKCEAAGILMAMKVTVLSFDNLDEIAMEIYYNSIFQHPRLLDLYGVQVKDSAEDDEIKQICTFSALMKWDAAKWLKTQKPSFLDRLKLAVQVAESLEYLHTQAIMHRDLKLANVLLDKDQQAYVADYGFVKSVGLTTNTFVGTPVHIAPEIVEKGNYDYSVDVYSFGILLWYLTEGSGRHPAYARYMPNVGAVLWAATADHKRPEKFPGLPDDLWELMTHCWSVKPSDRPSIRQVLDRLQEMVLRQECS